MLGAAEDKVENKKAGQGMGMGLLGKGWENQLNLRWGPQDLQILL